MTVLSINRGIAHVSEILKLKRDDIQIVLLTCVLQFCVYCFIYDDVSEI